MTLRNYRIRSRFCFALARSWADSGGGCWANTMVTQTHTAAPPSAGRRTDLIGLTREELRAALASVGLEPFRTQQVWTWIYAFGVTDFAAMTNIAKPSRALLEEHFTISRPAVDSDLRSQDGTRKWLLSFPDKNKIETVHIPEEDRGTLCVSSQVGCTLTCTFCHTGTQRLVRNLEAEEIIGQVLLARDKLGEWPQVGKTGKHLPSDSDVPVRSITNIVLMGMGEPLYNYENVARALNIIMDPQGISLSKRRITLSTSGIVPLMRRCGEELGVNLALSLHAVNDELRDELVPINRKYPLAELMRACREYPTLSNARRITFEYVMLKGVNDSDAEARALVRLIRGIPAKVNLIPFNPWPGAPYECASNNRIRSFAQIVLDAGYASPVRTPRGQDIFAACGQLKSESLRRSKSRVRPCAQ